MTPEPSGVPLFEPTDESAETAEQSPPPWEQIAAGRYMPRRIRGSYRGRELG